MLWFCRSEMINCGAVKHLTTEINVGHIALNLITYLILYLKHILNMYHIIKR